MRVVVPWVPGMLREETVTALDRAGVPWESCSMPAWDSGAYGSLLEQLWRDGRSFCVLEQDVVPTGAMLFRLAACRGDWCSHCYDDPAYPRTPMLGLVRFSAALIERHPEVGVHVLRTGHTRRQHVAWPSVNETLCRHLWRTGEVWHRHRPDVVHLHRRSPAVAG